MTLRKYKKLLMGHGFDRDQAEFERKNIAKIRARFAKEGIDPGCAMTKRGDIDSLVMYRKRFGCTSRRGYIKHMKQLMKAVIVV